MSADRAEPVQRSLIDVRPLLTVLEKITAAGRARKASGIDDTAVKYARLARLALEWFRADEEGDIETARAVLDKIHAMPF